MKQYIAVPPGLFHRKVSGRTFYSHVVSASGSRLIFVVGQVAGKEDGTIVGKGDMRAQIRQVLQNIRTALAAAGATMDDIVEMTTFTTDLPEYFRHADVRYEFFREGRLPATTEVAVPPGGISYSPDFLVETKAIAIAD